VESWGSRHNLYGCVKFLQQIAESRLNSFTLSRGEIAMRDFPH